MRFFDINYALKQFPGTSAASSQSANAAACFDGLDYTCWISNEEDTDGDVIYIERDFINAKTFNRVFVKDTNILNISLEYWTGAAWVVLVATTTKSQDNKNILFQFAPQSIPKIRIIGSNTIIADEEKEIQEILCFSEIGRLIIPPADIKTKRNKKQDIHQLESSKYFIFNRGKNISIELNFKSHIGQVDIDLLNILFNRDTEFYIWINDNEEQYMAQKVSPFRFEDVLKMSISKGDNPAYYKNLFFSGVNNKLSLVETA